jgi:hypothetical protein
MMTFLRIVLDLASVGILEGSTDDHNSAPMPGVCWSGGIRSCAPMLLFRPFGSGGSGMKLRSLLPSGDILVHGEVRDEEYHEGRIGRLAK